MFVHRNCWPARGAAMFAIVCLSVFESTISFALIYRPQWQTHRGLSPFLEIFNPSLFVAAMANRKTCLGIQPAHQKTSPSWVDVFQERRAPPKSKQAKGLGRGGGSVGHRMKLKFQLVCNINLVNGFHQTWQSPNVLGGSTSTWGGGKTDLQKPLVSPTKTDEVHKFSGGCGIRTRTRGISLLALRQSMLYHL